MHYSALRQPTDPTTFIEGLRERVTAALTRLDQALVDAATGGVRIITRRGEPWISVPKLAPLPEPQHLQAVKDEVVRRWGTLDLLDVLKDSDFLADFTSEFTSVASREVIDRDTLRRRLLLCLFALGTNMGIKAIVSTGEHGETEAQLRHVRRHFITRDNLRRAIAKLVNATFDARDPGWWGTGTACASDSKKFGSWESNLMTEWHQRYGGPGVMIYWHVERRSTCIYSQLKSCSSSEVAAMIEGLLRHCTDADIDTNYVDTHGASVVGFAFTELLGFRLLPSLEEHRLDPPLPPRRHPYRRRVRAARPGPDPPDPVGADRPAVRPDGQVRDRAAARHRRIGDDPAPVHPRRPQTPHLRRAGRTRPRGPDDLRLRLPRLSRICAARSMAGCRWWRTGTPATPSSSTARTAT